MKANSPFKVTETEEVIVVEAFGRAHWVKPEAVQAMTWDARRRRFSIECAARYRTGLKIHNALYTFESVDGGDFTVVGVGCKNGGNVYPVAFWGDFLIGGGSAAHVSRHGAEKARALKADADARTYWKAAHACDSGAVRILGTFIAPDFATFLARLEALRAQHPAKAIAFTYWQK